MPVLVIDGVIQAEYKRFAKACSCEWCGRYVTVSECGTLTEILEGEGPSEPPWVTVLTRMCAECIHIRGILGKDGLTE